MTTPFVAITFPAHKGEKRFGGLSPREEQLLELVQQALGLDRAQTSKIYGYGCWCGFGGMGRTADNFDFCCKAHDFCELNLVKPDKCGGNPSNVDKRFEYDAATDTCTGGLCKTEADVIVLIQDSQSISEGTRPSIQRIVKTLLNSLNSDDTDYNFVMGRYGSKTKMNRWGSAAKAISYLNKNYPKGGLGLYNRLIRVLKKSVAKKFNKRSARRKGKDPVKIVVLFTDGNTEDGRGRLVDTFKLLSAEKKLRVDNDIHLVGALIPNVKNTQRIDQLESIVSDPNDAINMEFTEANLNKIADRLAYRVRRLLVCRVPYTVVVFTPTKDITSKFHVFIMLVGTGGKKTEDLLLYKDKGAKREDAFKYEVRGIDVGDITEVRIKSERKIITDASWELRKVKVTQGDQTVTAVFKENIGAFDKSYKSATPRKPKETVNA
nr:uncharacterized protein LOC131798905 [Pocillopora verrucosa]